jgi:hypothetical protein
MLTTLALASPAQADTICKNCEYWYYGAYLGAYWPHDRAGFGNREIVSNLRDLGYGDGQSRGFDDYWVFDLNDDASVTLTVDTKGTLYPAPGYPPHFAVEIYPDTGSVCGEFRCDISLPDFVGGPIVSHESKRRWTASTPLLPPGRYIIRIAGETAAAGESAYTAKLRVRAPK